MNTKKETILENMDEFTRAFLECALWSSADLDGNQLDDEYEIEDIEAHRLKELIEDCQSFQSEHFDLIRENLSRAGDDFWLTRNGHGAGFWDGYWPEEIGKKLTEASKVYGSVDLLPNGNGGLE